jgi:hypothetical protein
LREKKGFERLGRDGWLRQRGQERQHVVILHPNAIGGVNLPRQIDREWRQHLDPTPPMDRFRVSQDSIEVK